MRRYLHFPKKHAEFVAFYLKIELLITSGRSLKSKIQLWHVWHSVGSANFVPPATFAEMKMKRLRGL